MEKGLETLTLTIDDQQVTVPQGTTVLQAIQTLGIEIPVFCYHPRLKIAGNCRMCLVEIQGGTKPFASCALPAQAGMAVQTGSPMVKKAREGVLEFLLINHPLDCPICDQGGECDLQDITMAYGRDRSRFQDLKRAVPEKSMGPLIKTVMTRCIHCSRCVRFAEDIAGVPELGIFFRGEKAEISTYRDQPLTSELSGNLVDICPVGALTSRPYAFQARSWELTKTPSIDVLDAVGSHISVETRGEAVKRIMPRECQALNESWISDKTRYACDALACQRLEHPYKRQDGVLVPCTWTEAFTRIKEALDPLAPQEIAAIAGDLVDLEAMVALKDFMTQRGVTQLECRQDNAYLDRTHRCGYVFNTTIEGIEQGDFCLLIGGHPRYDAPLINARLRKRFLKGGFSVYRLGGGYAPKQGATFPIEELGPDLRLLQAIAQGHHEISEDLRQAQYPMIIVSQEVLCRSDAPAVVHWAQVLTETYGLRRQGWNGFNVLHKAAARVGALDIGFAPPDPTFRLSHLMEKIQKKSVKAVYLLGADELDFQKLKAADPFIIYQGHHGDRGAHGAHVVLPGAAYTEKKALYVNTEGRCQESHKALNPPGDAKEDWKIIRALSNYWDVPVPYDTLEALRDRIFQEFPHVIPVSQQHAHLGTPQKNQKNHGETLENLEALGNLEALETLGRLGKPGDIHKTPLAHWTGGFYTGDVLCRNSKTMAQCASVLEAFAQDQEALSHA